jgi:hypothetical protein
MRDASPLATPPVMNVDDGAKLELWRGSDQLDAGILHSSAFLPHLGHSCAAEGSPEVHMHRWLIVGIAASVLDNDKSAPLVDSDDLHDKRVRVQGRLFVRERVPRRIPALVPGRMLSRRKSRRVQRCSLQIPCR